MLWNVSIDENQRNLLPCRGILKQVVTDGVSFSVTDIRCHPSFDPEVDLVDHSGSGPFASLWCPIRDARQSISSHTLLGVVQVVPCANSNGSLLLLCVLSMTFCLLSFALIFSSFVFLLSLLLSSIQCILRQIVSSWRHFAFISAFPCHILSKQLV